MNRKVNIIVVGESGAGKSSLINAITPECVYDPYTLKADPGKATIYSGIDNLLPGYSLNSDRVFVLVQTATRYSFFLFLQI